MAEIAQGRSVGTWNVDVSIVAGVTAQRRTSSEVFSSSLTLFPVGWRVGKRWTNGVADVTASVPKAVIKAADSMAKELYRG